MGLDIAAEFGELGSLSAADEVWEWYSAALAWSLYTLPYREAMILSTPIGYVQFHRADDGVECEVSSNEMLGEQRISRDGEAALAAQGWASPQPEIRGASGNWAREIHAPAEFEEYEHVAALVVTALRNVLELPLPFELDVRTPFFDTDSTDEIRGRWLLARPDGYSAEQLRTATPTQLRRLTMAGWAALEQSKRPRHRRLGWTETVVEGGVRMVTFDD
ncbi:TY-Chap domain-containing protein [Nocardia sp. NPDC003693]